MNINEHMIGHIEKALNVTLTVQQKMNLLSDRDEFWAGGRGNGRTFVHCIRLALSDGDPLSLSKPEKLSDCSDSEILYSRGYYRRMLMEIWHKLRDYGFKVREVKF